MVSISYVLHFWKCVDDVPVFYRKVETNKHYDRVDVQSFVTANKMLCLAYTMKDTDGVKAITKAQVILPFYMPKFYGIAKKEEANGEWFLITKYGKTNLTGEFPDNLKIYTDNCVEFA